MGPSSSAVTSANARRWRSYAMAAWLLRTAIFAAPLAAAVGLSLWLAPRLFVPESARSVLVWWLVLVSASAATAWGIDRLGRRLLPLTVMLKMTMVFPDRAPSRFKVALRSTNLGELRRRVAQAEEEGNTNLGEMAGLIMSLASALNDYDRRLRGHGERTRAYADMLAAELGVSREGRDKLRWAAFLHDVGKIEIPFEILNKDGPLDASEWEIVKRHPVLGMRVAAPLVPWLGEWAAAIEAHHEWWDGSGYPRGLGGEQIPLAARIVSVADAFDVMTSGRHYQQAKTPEAARREVTAMAGIQFAPEVARALMNVSLGRIRWAMGPLAWLGQVPFFLDRLGRDVVTVASAAAVTAGVLLASLASIPAAGDSPSGVSDEGPIPAQVDTTIDTGTETPVFTVSPGGGTSADVPQPSPTEPSPAPAAHDDVATTREGEPVSIDVLANDAGLELDRITSPPRSGIADIEDRRVVYTPAPTFQGTDTFSYRGCDSDGRCATATVAVRVSPANRPPEATDDSATTSSGGSVVIDVLANDTDPDGDRLRVVSLDRPAHGKAVSDRITVTYTPAPGFVGTESFGYEMCDGAGGCDTAVVTVEVKP